MIPYEKYGKNNDEEEEFFEKVPTWVIVITLILLSLVGIYIVFEAIYGL